MIDILMFPIGFLIGLAIFHAVEGQRVRYEPCDTFVRANADSLACVRIVGITPSNNNFDPIGDNLSDLDEDGVQNLLGKPLCTDIGRHSGCC